MNTEIENTLGRINAQVDRFSDTYNKAVVSGDLVK